MREECIYGRKRFQCFKKCIREFRFTRFKKVSDNFLTDNDILDKIELPELKEMTKEEYIKWRKELEKNKQNEDVNSTSKKL